MNYNERRTLSINELNVKHRAHGIKIKGSPQHLAQTLKLVCKLDDGERKEEIGEKKYFLLEFTHAL